MKKIELNEIKILELDILKDLDRVCRENGILYSLTSGTLIGAVRHKGFIPWDDDIDIMMTRENYDKFIKVYPEKGKDIYKLLCHELDKEYYHQFSKIVDLRTCVKEKKLRYINNLGIWIDIFPVDSINSKFLKLRLNKINFFQKSLKKTKGDLNVSNRNAFIKFIKKNFFVDKLEFWYNRTINQVKKESKKANNNLKGILLSDAPKPEKLLLEKELFNDYIYLKFENENFMAIKEYDKYLTHVYGNYMQIPPIEKRESHYLEAYWKGEKNG